MVIAGLFVTVWALSVAIWKLGRIEERYDPSEQPVVASLDK
jgi:hypothetical protein